jgi:radical SAM superfamily enzyme YgiQ (UPF0313 family)
MKILLINPKVESSFWTYSEVLRLAGFCGYMPNIALATLAALTPDDIEVSIVDEGAEPIDFDQHWDVIGITGYITQRRRMIEIADEFRRRNRLVAVGGPYATLSPSVFRGHADILFRGEAEKTWPQFLADFRHGNWKDSYMATEPVDLASSPVPDISRMRLRSYMIGVVQTSRGCPFECEFCDVIIYLGRNQRHKSPEQVVREAENMYRFGYRHIFLADDNLTANRRRCAEIMTALGQWNSGKEEPVRFSTQMSVDVARDRDEPLLELCAKAGLDFAFIGIESSDPEAHKDIKKRQNLRDSLVRDIQHIQNHGIIVAAGMISGFDTDTRNSFRRNYEFLQDAGPAITQLTLLNAPEGTPLEKRLSADQRLKPWQVDDTFFSTNIIPKRMSYEDLLTGYRWMLNKMYSPSSFLKRMQVFSENAPPAGRMGGQRYAVNVLQRLIPEIRKLGSEYREIPDRMARMFSNKDAATGNVLLFFLNAQLLMRKRGLWDPELSVLDEPAFSTVAV